MKTCPSCQRPLPEQLTDNRHLPFCSERCRLMDLGAWLSESHRIPAEPLTDILEDDEFPPVHH